MSGRKWLRVGQIAAATILAVCWPPVLLALGYAILPLAGELATSCTPVLHPSVWGPVALLSLGLFVLTVLRVFSGRSPWRWIDHARTTFLTIALLWVGGLGALLVYMSLAFPPPLLLPLLASPALIPLVQSLSALNALRRTDHWKAKKRIALLSAITLGLPTLWITAMETLAWVVSPLVDSGTLSC